MKVEGLRYPYELKLYSPNDSDFKEYLRFVYPYSDSGKEMILATALGYVCIIGKGNKPIYTGEILTHQMEFPLSYLKWLLAVITRFQLRPAQGGYPVDTFSDILQLDEENELFVQRAQNFALQGIFGYNLENRRRHSYIYEHSAQSDFISDEYLFEYGMMDALLRIQKDYEDGKLEGGA